MSIQFINESAFHLKNKSMSYLLGFSPQGLLQHLYWGAALSNQDAYQLARDWHPKSSSPHHESLEQEFAVFGHNDLRSPALLLEQADGSRLSFFTYKAHEILPGKPERTDLPASYVENGEEASTLKIILEDGVKGHQLELFYTIYENWNVLQRWSVLQNNALESVNILRLMSASLDLPARSYQAISLPGDWARERHWQQFEVPQGITRLESRRGLSSHQMNPFCFLSQGQPSETQGQIFACGLAYSGNWLIEMEGHASGRLRLNSGLNDFDFKWQLKGGQSFATPECLLAWSPEGLGGLSHQLHTFINQRLVPGPWREKARPVLINNWEATYFNFKQQDILNLAKEAKELGVDLLVLDDGWFGRRDDDRSSLGDWFVHSAKLPQGLGALAGEIHGLGLQFGLWFEPEAISPDSDLYRKHPDWALHIKSRPSTTWRNQLVLDMSRPEIRDYLFERMASFIKEAKLDYVKWDMNRSLWEVGNELLPAAQQAELSHRYLLGVYDLERRIQKEFPFLLVEGCAGGGGRFDLGMLAFHPQIWTSDNTDGLERIFVQYSSSLAYPLMAQSAHVSVVPNHQTHRETPLSWRIHVAMSANFGLELDLRKCLPQEKKDLAEAIKLYKQIQPLIHHGRFYRLANPYEGNLAAWGFVSPDQSQGAFFAFRPRALRLGLQTQPLPLAGLDPKRHYELPGQNKSWSGAYLMQYGLQPNLAPGDYQSVLIQLRSV